MENLETKLHAVLPNRLKTNVTHVAVTTFPTPSIFTLHHSNSHAQYCTHPIDLYDDPTSQNLSIDSKPVALTVHNESPLLACRDGALISLKPDGPEHLGDFTDDDPSRSGILAAASSPDGCLLLVVSPVSVSILDAEFEIIAELPCDGMAQDARIAWRSDGDFFVVLRRVADKTVGFVADRACDVVKGLELEDTQKDCCVDWEPRAGGMIAVSHGSAVLFFERNGLRHRRSDFDAGRSVTLIRWAGGARALLIFGGGVLDVWMKRNYAWYCKKRMVLPGFADALWDEDDPRLLRIFLSSGEVRVLRFNIVPSTCLSFECGPLLAVAHGDSVILTNLTAGIIPPPMNHGFLKFTAGVESICALEKSNMMGCLLADGSFETAALHEPPGKPMFSIDPLKENSLPAVRNSWRLQGSEDVPTCIELPFRTPVLITEGLLAVVQQHKPWTDREMPNDEIHIFRLREQEAVGERLGKHVAEGQITSMRKSAYGPTSVAITASSGTLFHLSVDPESGDCVEISRNSCGAARNAFSVLDTRVRGGSLLSLAHSEEGKLEFFDTSKERSTTLSHECTSFTLLGDFLVFTTRSNLLYCVPLRSDHTRTQESIDNHGVLPSSAGGDGDRTLISDKGTVRPIDRGAVIVSSLQDAVSVVLQAPRGNLETIVPRPAVLNKISELVATENFAPAFALCRRQRINMNHIVDADFPLFMKNVDAFVSQIGITEHLSVFMTLLTGDQSKVNAVCKAVVTALQNVSNPDQFSSAILTGMMKVEPRDFEGALQEIKRASTTSKETGRVAVDYLFVIVKNQELIYDHALGTYDLDLASFVAESSQMDPAAYHPELTNLRKLEERERKIAIDLKLERYHKALVNLHSGGRTRFQDCVSLCLEHSLYDTALKLFREEEDIMKILLDGYAKALRIEGRFVEAAAVFRQIDDSRGACECYRLGGKWQLAAHVAASSSLSQEEKLDQWTSIATDLEENGRIVESAQVRASFLGEIGTALASLVEGEEWEAAFEIAARAEWSQSATDEKPHDHNTGLTSELVQSASTFNVHIEENWAKLEDRNRRLTTLRNTKQIMREHLARKQTDHEADSDVFSETTASSISNLSDVTFYSKTSATSLYSTATQTGPLSSAKLEKKALRRKQRESKKRIREGHPREEEAIVVYIRKLLPTEFTLRRAESFVRALLFVKKADLAVSLTQAFRNYVAESLNLPDDVLGEEKVRLEKVLKDWIGGLPKAMAHVDEKMDATQESR